MEERNTRRFQKPLPLRARGFESHPPHSHSLMRTKEEVALALALVAEGLNDCEIGRRTGIPRGTIRDWRHGKTPRRRRRRCSWESGISDCDACGHGAHQFDRLPVPEYTYLLGVYLGDGCISRTKKGGYFLRLFQDMRYENLIDDWYSAVVSCHAAQQGQCSLQRRRRKVRRHRLLFELLAMLVPPTRPGSKA